MQLIKIVAISSCLVTLHMNVSPATASSAENGRKRARLDVATACAISSGNPFQEWEEVSMYRSISWGHYTDFSRQIPLHEKNEVAKTITHTFISLFHEIAKAHLASVSDYEDEDTSDLENSSVCSGCKAPSQQGD